jgi:hypothetical protein
MFFSQATAWFIIVVAGTVFHTAHITTINTAASERMVADAVPARTAQA